MTPDPKPLSADEIAHPLRILAHLRNPPEHADAITCAQWQAELQNWAKTRIPSLLAAAEREGELRDRAQYWQDFSVRSTDHLIRVQRRLEEQIAALRADLDGARGRAQEAADGWLAEIARVNAENAALRCSSPIVEHIRAIAKRLGWAIGVHGSLVRDIDLIAAPWTDEARSLDDFLAAIVVECSFLTGTDGRVEATPKPWGRRAALLLRSGAGCVSDPKGRWIPAAVDLSLVDPREALGGEGEGP